MQIIIFEGIATSGKSTVINKLVEVMADEKILVLEEDKTHIPIMKKTGELCIDFFKNLIKKELNNQEGLVLLDRLYLTQAFRAGVTLEKYSEIENLLLPHNPTTVFLRVDDDSIADRVTKAAAHRDSSWGEYIKTKGSSQEEIASYYINQQKNQIELLKQSKLPYKIFNTTDHNYDKIAQEIQQFL